MRTGLVLCALLGLAACVDTPDSPFTDSGDNVSDDAGSGDGGFVPCTNLEVTVTVSGDDDDGAVYANMVYVPGMPGGTSSGPGIYIGNYSNELSWGYFRFALPIDFSPSYLNARIQLRLWGLDTLSWNDNGDALRVVLEDTASAAPVTTSDRAPSDTTDASLITRWPATGQRLVWNTSGYNESPDLAASFRQLEQTHGLEPGQSVQLWVGGFPDTGDSQVVAFDSSQANANPAELRFECP